MIDYEKEMSNLITVLLNKYSNGEIVLKEDEIVNGSNSYIECYVDYENKKRTYKVRELR